MGLTSETTVYVMAAVAVVCVALLVWLWPRLAKPGVRQVLGRLTAIGVTQVTIIAAFACWLNSSYQFFGSWDELFGNTDTAPVGVTQAADHNGDSATGVSVKGALVQPASDEQLNRVSGLPTGNPAVNGKVESVKVIGRRTGVVDPAFVYLPPQYFQKAYARQRFPVVVALSGYPGSIFNLAQYLRVSQTAGQLQKNNQMQPTIMVMIRPTIAPPRDTECVNVPGGPQTETFLAKDLPQALKSAYRVGHDASAWGVMGYSSGGSCALQLTMRNPHVYTTAAALSPDYKVKDDPTTGNLFGSGLGRVNRVNGHDLMWRLKHLPAPQVSVLVAESKHGERGYPQTLAFIKAVKAPMRVVSILPESGSHNFPTWVREMPAALKWMNQQLTFPQDVVPRHLPKKKTHSTVRAEGTEPTPTARTHK
ncbi:MULTISPECIES: esterase family protein [unclassified Streptomyces]|uniref:alpha/beta hydrolase n=1 Tax=unclassified Streptomyces TaxID=2593676 RepID=UPI00190ABC3A|nr:MULTISPECIES: alpha/beta hydrolase-fold protein [unclassified Streptomyces]MBK3570280.1 esterase [Streptomyces sp. MBT62]MBK6017940.1 esterase [Streptomyces sp. MBT53]